MWRRSDVRVKSGTQAAYDVRIVRNNWTRAASEMTTETFTVQYVTG